MLCFGAEPSGGLSWKNKPGARRRARGQWTSFSTSSWCPRYDRARARGKEDMTPPSPFPGLHGAGQSLGPE